MNIRKTDVVIIGSGLGSLMTAESLCAKKDVMIITKSRLSSSNSWLAQGGIAAAITKEDHWKKHFQDTIIAGSYHNNKKATELLVKQGSSMIQKLMNLGVCFDKSNSQELSLGMEGAHSMRRILHVGGDATGKGIVHTLLQRVSSRVKIFEEEMAYDLIINNNVCNGVYTKDSKGNVNMILAKHVVLATGGAGQLYSSTSNCKEATGDGVAMAFRVGAAIADMEFIQFHPTLLKDESNSSLGLISEAVRGEGAKLVLKDGTFLMKGKHPLEDLAPRDVVAREIYKMFVNKQDVFLDISYVPNFKNRFPSIYKLCKENNISIERGLLPVKPGAHFIMGGIVVNEVGQSTIPGLYAVGECAYTGVHGANRLASNSLLEAVVFAEKLSQSILEAEDPNSLISTSHHKRKDPELADVELPTLQEINDIMDRYVGITRMKKDLLVAIEWFDKYKPVLDQYHLHLSIQKKEICNMLTVGFLIARSALKRNESRGAHYRIDYPKENNQEWLGFQNKFTNKQLLKDSLNTIEVKTGRHIS